MRFDVLRYMLEINSAGSFHKAAEKLFISQQGLNKAISKTEQELGYTLLNRGRAGASLTKEGEIFAKHAKTLLGQYDCMMEELAASQSSRFSAKGITLNMTPYAFRSAFAVAAERGFTAIRDVRTREMMFSDAMMAVEDARGDEVYLLNFMSDLTPISNLKESHRFIPLFQERIGVSWGGEFPIESTPWVSRDFVSGLPLAVFSEGEARDAYNRVFEDSPLRDVRFLTGERDLIARVVSRGEVASLSDTFMEYRKNCSNGNLRFAAIDTDFTCDVGFVYSTNSLPSERAIDFMERFRAEFEESCKDYFEFYAKLLAVRPKCEA